MDIQEINKDIIAYLAVMIKNNDTYDIYNISEEEFDDIQREYLWSAWERGRSDIITEYYGNVITFIPSPEAFCNMMDFMMVVEAENELEVDEELWYRISYYNGNGELLNMTQRYAECLKHYAISYIIDMRYEGFLKALKEWVEDNISESDDE